MLRCVDFLLFEIISYTVMNAQDSWCADLTTDCMQLLPWGGKLTSESLKFFSPIVIWTRFSSSYENYDILFSAFTDYYKVSRQGCIFVILLPFFIIVFSILISCYKLAGMAEFDGSGDKRDWHVSNKFKSWGTT